MYFHRQLLQPRRDYGQHFLRNAVRAEGLVDHLDRWQPVEVLEIGAGLGTLSRAILRRGYRLWAIEKDRRMASVLEECGLGHTGRLRVTIGDVHDVAVEEQLGPDAALLSILPFDQGLSFRILDDVFGRAEHLLRGVVVMPKSVVAMIDGLAGLSCVPIGCLDEHDFVPVSPVALAVAVVTRI